MPFDCGTQDNNTGKHVIEKRRLQIKKGEGSVDKLHMLKF